MTPTRSGARRLDLFFSISGAVADIAWHKAEEEGRFDELWKHSCFEGFVRAGAAEGYVEVNLAPRRRWALYRLDGYRTGLRWAVGIIVQNMTFKRLEDISPRRVRMRAALQLPFDFAQEAWALGLSVIIEETDGTKSYWALAHVPGPPDFHNADCFTARLPAPDAP